MDENSERDEPDHTEDPRKAGVGGGGYPEESPAGDGDGVHDAEEPPAPDTSSPEEGDPGQATGNPNAAGGN